MRVVTGSSAQVTRRGDWRVVCHVEHCGQQLVLLFELRVPWRLASLRFEREAKSTSVTDGQHEISFAIRV